MDPRGIATLVMLRHAEKGPGGDPSLTDVGKRRAIDLAHLLSASGAIHLWSTAYKRTRETLEPLASVLGLEVTTLDTNPEAWMKAIAAIGPGKVAVACGHQNTVPAVVKALGGTIGDVELHGTDAWLHPKDYDRLFLISWPVGVAFPSAETQVIELRYGAHC